MKVRTHLRVIVPLAIACLLVAALMLWNSPDVRALILPEGAATTEQTSTSPDVEPLDENLETDPLTETPAEDPEANTP